LLLTLCRLTAAITMNGRNHHRLIAEAVMNEEMSREEVHSAVDRAVEELLAEIKISTPPLDAAAVARILGVEVEPTYTRGQRSGAKKEFLTRPEQTPETKQWLAARAIGEHLQPSLLQRLGIPPEQKRLLMGESLATLVASHLLLPTAWFAGDARTLAYDVLELKKRYATVAADVIAWRLLDLPEPCIITIIDNDHVQRRRSNAWRVRRELEEPERECQRYVNHFSRPRVVCANGWTIHGWPVHKSDWKREILRSVVDGDMEN
jgi:hypothetical protein